MCDLRAILERAEVDIINDHLDQATGRHPAWSIINANDKAIDYTREPKDYLTNQAVGMISGQSGGRNWLQTIKKRIAQITDSEGAASALAETRCYGALLEAGFSVTPNIPAKSPTPDFRFEAAGLEGFVEVATKMEHEDQTDRARQIAAGSTPAGVERSHIERGGTNADFTISECHPFGAPDPSKDGDSTQTNAISRICAIKGKETQVTAENTNILWLDFRDFSRWTSMLKKHDTAPLISGRGGSMTSGPFWYAFYGWNGAPVLEEELPHRQRTVEMKHYGRFHPDAPRKSFYSASVINLSKSTIVFENPACPKPLSSEVRLMLTKLPWFDVNHSAMNWAPDDVLRTIALSRSKIEALAAAFVGRAHKL